MIKKIFISILFISIVIISWCSKPQLELDFWDRVMISYSAKFEDWSVFQSWETKIDANIWDWAIIKWIEEAIIWLKQWDQKEILINPENWFWNQYNKNNTHNISKIIFDRIWLEPKLWQYFKISDIQWIITATEWSGDNISYILDANPRQTYQNLIFKVKIENITKSQKS